MCYNSFWSYGIAFELVSWCVNCTFAGTDVHLALQSFLKGKLYSDKVSYFIFLKQKPFSIFYVENWTKKWHTT